MSIGVTVEIYD